MKYICRPFKNFNANFASPELSLPQSFWVILWFASFSSEKFPAFNANLNFRTIYFDQFHRQQSPVAVDPEQAMNVFPKSQLGYLLKRQPGYR